jgi:hypothetical protein
VGLATTISTAVIKASAVSTSTLTTINGALKLMAWTKAKMALAVVLPAAGITTVAVNAVNNARTKTALAAMQGNREGVVTVNQAQLRLILRVFQTNDTYQAVFDAVDQGANAIPITILTATARTSGLPTATPSGIGVTIRAK